MRNSLTHLNELGLSQHPMIDLYHPLPSMKCAEGNKRFWRLMPSLRSTGRCEASQKTGDTCDDQQLIRIKSHPSLRLSISSVSQAKPKSSIGISSNSTER